MAKYKSIVVTNGGLALVAAAHSGDTIEFTAVKTGAGVYDGTEVLAEATDLKDLKQTMGITGITKDNNVIKVRAVLSNEGLSTAYKITELGLYAKDSSGNEVLYAIVIAETGMEDYLPAYADAPTGITMEMYIDATAYESGVTFQATVIAGIYATVEDLNDSVSSINSRINTMESSIIELNDNFNNYIAENLIPYPYFQTSCTNENINYTDNGDGTINANGTATGSFSGFTCRLYNEGHLGYQLVLPKGTYTLTGCPSGNSDGTYFLQVGRTNPNTGSWQTIATDTGEGATFTIDEEMQVSVTIVVMGGTTVNNLVFKPMLEVGTVAHEYKPYSSTKLTKGDIVDNLVTGRADLPLSAKQGVVIAEAITEISTDLNRWNIAQGTKTTVFYNRTHLRLIIARDGYSLETDTSDRTTFALPSNIIAKEDLFFQGMALTTSWHPTSTIVFGVISANTNQITIKASGKLTNNVLITEVMFPRNCFTIE